MKKVKVPAISSNEDSVVISEINFKNNSLCKLGQKICVLESTKSAVDVIADLGGYINFLFNIGDEVKTNQTLCIISEEKLTTKDIEKFRENKSNGINNLIVTKKAKKLLEENLISPETLKSKGVIKLSDVTSFIKSSQESSSESVENHYDDLEKILKSYESGSANISDVKKLKETLLLIENIYSKKWNRKIPITDILFDRWSLSERQKFGKDTNIYHNSHVFGDVKVGKKTFIGPYTIIDGSGGLEIGDFCSIAAGVHIYSHDTISRSISSYQKSVSKAKTKIGNSCFIGPNSVITKGVTIGDHCFVGANSVVTQDLESFSAVSGNPTQIIGKVVLSSDGSVSIKNQD